MDNKKGLSVFQQLRPYIPGNIISGILFPLRGFYHLSAITVTRDL